MSKGRLEAFSDGVLAIVLTITVLKLNPPGGFDAASLKPFASLLMAYVIGYTFVGIQWINHHRLFDPLESVTPKIMWKNLNWLF
ncbi:TMEM175 family protein [Schaalia sp. Marseille-Q2122]|uniref:TMEM175 family protein n=1 Tax=Schaalia sp. Marseille-Q2122 TaxID=2736604 RepID=UPI00158961A2|nr:TMEM175 family protein [Schaalia sp. Marseille-Q2122]